MALFKLKMIYFLSFRFTASITHCELYKINNVKTTKDHNLCRHKRSWWAAVMVNCPFECRKKWMRNFFIKTLLFTHTMERNWTIFNKLKLLKMLSKMNMKIWWHSMNLNSIIWNMEKKCSQKLYWISNCRPALIGFTNFYCSIKSFEIVFIGFWPEEWPESTKQLTL